MHIPGSPNCSQNIFAGRVLAFIIAFKPTNPLTQRCQGSWTSASLGPSPRVGTVWPCVFCAGTNARGPGLSFVQGICGPQEETSVCVWVGVFLLQNTTCLQSVFKDVSVRNKESDVINKTHTHKGTF